MSRPFGPGRDDLLLNVDTVIRPRSVGLSTVGSGTEKRSVGFELSPAGIGFGCVKILYVVVGESAFDG